MSEAARGARSMRQSLLARPHQPKLLADALAERKGEDPALRQVTLRLHPAVHEALAGLAVARKLSVNALLHVLIDEALIGNGLRSVLELDPTAPARLR